MKNRFDRQSFLGLKSQEIISATKVGIIGLGGGGSHIVQQLAHVGFRNYVLLDADKIDDTNLNRLVGGTENDVKHSKLKIKIARRTISRIYSKANIKAYPQIWQEELCTLKDCDIIFGCVDGFLQRRDIEGFSRRYLIPYIDIGMDVNCTADEIPRVYGQVILSMPGYACMFCMGFLTDKNLAKEGTRYGDAGKNPQVVWSNGILASVAISIAVDLLTNWSKSSQSSLYLSYDGNKNTITPDNRLKYLTLNVCPHYPLDEIGEPNFKGL